MPKVHVVADADTAVPIPSDTERKRIAPGHYQGITLNLDTGAVFFDPEDWRKDYKVLCEERRGVSDAWSSDWQPVRSRVRWMIDNGFEDHSVEPPRPRPYFTVEEGNALAAELVPAMQRFADAMIPVPGRPGLWDWTAEAAAVSRAISARVDRDYTPIGDVDAIKPDPWMRDITELADRVPGFDDVFRKRYAFWDNVDELTDHQIYQCAADFGRGYIDASFPGVLDVFGLPFSPAYEGAATCGKFRVLGTTAYLCGLREQLANGRTVIDAARWFEANPVPAELIDLSHTELAAEARRINDRLAESGVLVVGIRDWALSNRGQLRDRVRRQLVELGRDAADKAREARAAKQRRNALINRVLTWGESVDTDTAVGKLAGMSHTAIGTLRRAADPA